MHGAIVKEHPEAYPQKADFRIDAVRLRDQITSPARTVLLVLLAASALVFVIACSNVANLILARSVRREGELAIRAALGASAGALRRTLLAESLLLCGAGAILGVVDRAADGGGAGALRLALLGARARPDGRREPAVGRRRPGAGGGGAAGVRAAPAVGGGAERPRPRRTAACGSRPARTAGCALFAVTQIAASFVLLAGAGMLLTTLFALQARADRLRHAQRAGAERAGHVVRAHAGPGRRLLQGSDAAHRASCPASSASPSARVVPWRDAGDFGPGFQFSAEGYVKADGEEDPRARFRTVSPGFFAALGVPIIAGRDFNDADRRDAREGRHRQPEPGAADVPEPGRGQPPPDVDRSGDEVHRREHRRRAASSASPPTSTTRTSCRGRR